MKKPFVNNRKYIVTTLFITSSIWLNSSCSEQKGAYARNGDRRSLPASQAPQNSESTASQSQGAPANTMPGQMDLGSKTIMIENISSSFCVEMQTLRENVACRIWGSGDEHENTLGPIQGTCSFTVIGENLPKSLVTLYCKNGQGNCLPDVLDAKTISNMTVSNFSREMQVLESESNAAVWKISSGNQCNEFSQSQTENSGDSSDTETSETEEPGENTDQSDESDGTDFISFNS